MGIVGGSQMKVRAQLEKEQEEINLMNERDYKQLQKNATKYKKQLELQQQQEQHQRWAQLNLERQAHRKLSTVSSCRCRSAPHLDVCLLLMLAAGWLGCEGCSVAVQDPEVCSLGWVRYTAGETDVCVS
jgi:hypothetical protein